MDSKIKNLPLICLPLFAFSTQAIAGYKMDIGYTSLQNELGIAIPDGSGVNVTQVEASSVPSTDSNYPVFAPNPNDGTNVDKTFTYPGLSCSTPPCLPSVFSAHAMGVANVFYGNFVSMASGIDDIHSYEVNQWINSLFVHNPNGQATNSDRRIANHSWAGQGATSTENSNVLRQVDRQVDRNEYIQVVASAGSKLMEDAYNAIKVGLTDGTKLSSSAIDATYVAGRAVVDLVAPSSVVSNATPIVAASAALLVQTGHEKTELSLGSRTVTSVGTVYNAERSETIKAALMAGADRQTTNTSGYGDITDYRSAGNQTSNGLDSRYGAGQVNINNSYHIIVAGEQNSLEDGGDNQGKIGLSGFDYDANFGGAANSNTTATYTFTANADEAIAASLVWNIGVSNNSAMNTTIHHLGLSLVDVSNNSVITTSDSLVDNTQNIFWTNLAEGHEYQLQVASLESSSFNWDYSIAWNRTMNSPVPLPGTFWLFGSALTCLIISRLKLRQDQVKIYL